MRFIMIKTPKVKWNKPQRTIEGESIAISVDNISSIRKSKEIVYLTMNDDSQIITQFTTIEAAVDYIQRAASVSMGVS